MSFDDIRLSEVAFNIPIMALLQSFDFGLIVPMTLKQ